MFIVQISSSLLLPSLTRSSISRLPGWSFPCPDRDGSYPSLSSAFFPPPPEWRYQRDHSQGSTRWSHLASCAWTNKRKAQQFKNVADHNKWRLKWIDRNPMMQQRSHWKYDTEFQAFQLSNCSYHLVRVSWMALVRAWPRWSDPVTLGGGIHIIKMPRGFWSLILFLCRRETGTVLQTKMFYKRYDILCCGDVDFLTPYSGLKNPCFSHHGYQAASTYCGL